MNTRSFSFKWSWLIPLICLAVLLVWLIETPDGLLGKADAIGYAVCHQITIRSFHLGERPLPLCARCSGMYIGAVIGIFYQLFRYPRRGGMLTWKSGIPFILFFGAWGFDGLNSYLHLFPGAPGLYEPNNTLRLITGLGMGLSMAAILVPAFHQSIWKEYDERQVFETPRPYLELVVLVAIGGAMMLSGNPLFLYPLALISSGGVVLVLGMVYTLIWCMGLKKINFAENWRQLFIPLCAGLLTAIVQIGAIDWVRYWFTGSWGGFHF